MGIPYTWPVSLQKWKWQHCSVFLFCQKASQIITHAYIGHLFATLFHSRLDPSLNNRPESAETAYNIVVDLAEFFIGNSASKEKFATVKNAVSDQDNRWWRFINRVLDETNPNVAKTMLLNLGYESFLRGTKEIRKNRERYQCNIPWLILFDPTSACNMHCKGCWSGTYGDKYDLSFADMDKIVTEGYALGIHLYMLTGGEPMVKKKEILRLAEKHRDIVLAFYTNSTLIDRTFCEEAVRLGNLLPLLSIEGTEETNDSRRGDGHYSAVMKAMDLLKEYGLVFGTSICYTRANIEAVTDLDFIRMLSDKGARFGFYFHYMPVGSRAVVDLIPTVDQRKNIIHRIRYIRSSECDIEFYPMDFQNDGEYVGGCIAGGRNYFHINSAGDAEPCVFINYSNANIHDSSILEILQSPLFMAYHKGQPFNHNHLRPCPMLENPDFLKKMVDETGAHNTDLEAPESVDELTDKCRPYAEQWKKEADEIWAASPHRSGGYQNYAAGNHY